MEMGVLRWFGLDRSV